MKRTKLLQLAAAALLTLLPTAMQAVPAYPGKHQLKRANGTTLTYYLRGDERAHWFEDEQGRRIEESMVIGEGCMVKGEGRIDQQNNSPFTLHHSPFTNHLSPFTNHQSSLTTFPTTGNVRGLVLLVEFSDVHFQENYTLEVFQGLLNGEGYSQHGAQGSARDYFVSQSIGKFTPQFDVVGPIRLTQPMDYYGADDEYGTDAHAGIMVQEACQQAHQEQGVDFSQYDYNADGLVDFVYIVYAGYGQNYGAPANTVWPHTASLPDWGISLQLDGKTVSRYACGCELKYTQGTQLEGIGTFCHEFGHVLGLPDFYDTRHSNSMRLGVWDIMDQGCYNNESRTPCAYSAFERYSLGWLDLTELNEPADRVELPELTQNNVAYRISTSRPDEYFILENRQQVGWDAALPARGMLISHVDYDQAVWDANTVNNGTDQHYILMAADGVVSSQNYATDLYPSGGNDKFTDTSSPNALSRTGQPTGKPVTRIRDVDGLITFRFMQDALPCPAAPAISDVTATSLTASWPAVSSAVAYRLQARPVLSAEEDPIVADETFRNLTDGSIGQPDNAEMGTVLDSYLSLEGWSGTGLRQAGGLLYIGTGGTLQSPLLDLSEPEGRFTVALQLTATAAATLHITAARNNGREITTEELPLESGEHSVVLHLEGGISRTRVSISATEGDAYLSRLRIVKDHVSTETAWADTNAAITVDGIEETTYPLMGLTPGQTYAVTLVALADDEELNSDPSAEVLVTTKTETEGIVSIGMSVPAAAQQAYDLLGRPAPAAGAAKGLRVLRTSDGHIRKVAVP
ncbi:MAG: M6 family metalloprotease domain-containing protein [Prevotella sp.]|nr:M6 family metalloprotease domain-containing protein [Prevotella sp.]